MFKHKVYDAAYFSNAHFTMLRRSTRAALGGGFTIVELLIVIVVIGILAALVLGVFSNARAQAANTQTIDAVGAWVKGIRAYAIDQNAYPTLSPPYACIGSPNGSGTCGVVSGATTCLGIGIANTNPTFNSALTPYIGQNLPQTNAQTMNCGGVTVSGALYTNWGGGVEGIYMFLNGNLPDCPSISGIKLFSRTQQDSATLCTYLFPAL